MEIEFEEATRAGDEHRWYKPTERQRMAEVNGLFIELQDLVPSDPLEEGKPFDGLVAGTFTDMSGRKFEFTDEDLGELVANTQRAIEATRSESGELVGLPIDAINHEAGDGAGWIVGVELVDGILRLTPKWTSIGLELISEGIRRFFSATVDTLRNVVMGGTLTNWPATRDNKTGEILLRPIELANLSQPIYRAELQDESLDERLNQIREAWWAQEPQTDGPTSYVAEGGVFEDHVIIDRVEGGFMKVPYSLSEIGEIEFSDESEWKPVQRTWSELMRKVRGLVNDIFRMEANTEDGEDQSNDRKPDADRSSGQEHEEDQMTDKVQIADLSDEDQKVIVSGVVAELGLDPESFKDDGNLGESMARLVDMAAERKTTAALEAETRKSEIAELADDLTGGSEDHPVGIPVEADKLKEFLSGLDDDQRKLAAEILSAITEKGLTEFSENGHANRVEGGTELDEGYAAQLTEFLAGSDKATVKEWFELNAAELGAMKDYDLSEFKQEESNG